MKASATFKKENGAPLGENANASSLVGINIEQLQPRGIEPGCNYVGKTLEHLVAEVVVFLHSACAMAVSVTASAEGVSIFG
jgi:hypothetical protein